jgi:hypothetical protein
MTVISNAPEATDRYKDRNELQTGSSPDVIESFTTREQMIADSYGCTEPFGYSYDKENIPFRREFSHPLSDPVEDWLHSLVSGVVLISLLIAILCLPSVTTTKTERPQPPPISQAESFLVTQNPR